MSTRTILIVEDGTEYLDAFTRLAPGAGRFELLRAADGEEARSLLASRKVDGVFLDVVFDRSPEERLLGDPAPLIARFGGDRVRALRHLAENQGFYLLDALAPILPHGLPIVIAYDFSAEPHRLEVLRQRAPGLSGLPDGASVTRALELLSG